MASTKPGPGYRLRETWSTPLSISSDLGIDEIETLRKWSARRKAHSFTRLGHRAGEGRGGYATRQHSVLAANFISLLFIAISLDIEVPWRDSGPLHFRFWLFNALKSALQKLGFNAPTLGPGGRLPQRVTAFGQKRVSLSLPTADFRRASASPIADVLETESRSGYYNQC